MGTQQRQNNFNRSRSGGGNSSRFGGGNRSYSSGGRNFGGGGGYNRRRGGGGRRFGGGKTIDIHEVIKQSQQTAEQKAETKPFEPSFAYKDLEIDAKLKENILAKGYETPTPIQDEAIPAALKGEDVLGIASTGTGKTAAFLIPLIQKVINNRNEKVLIITPTRELAEQINSEIFGLTKHLRVFTVNCIGGNSIQFQIKNIRRGFNFIVGTPGRLKDLTDRNVLDYSSFSSIVLDEVDRMLDMGFVDEIKLVISKLPEEKQSLFFSATIDRKVEALISTLLRPDHAKITIAKNQSVANINQDVLYFTDPEHRSKQLQELIETYDGQRVLIFANTKRDVDRLSRDLFGKGFKTEVIHGDKRQSWRKRAIDKFKSGQINVLIATDVAARGLDIDGVKLVVNFDVPTNKEDYIHRIGRTGRADATGDAMTFVRK